MVSAWLEPASVRPADTTAGVLDGVEVFAFRTTETEKGVGKDPKSTAAIFSERWKGFPPSA